MLSNANSHFGCNLSDNIDIILGVNLGGLPSRHISDNPQQPERHYKPLSVLILTLSCIAVLLGL